MTKKEFIEAIKDMPDDAEVKYWDLNTMNFLTATPHYFEEEQFIGIE